MKKKTGPKKGTPRASVPARRALQRRKFVAAYVGGGEGTAGQAGPAALAAGLATTPGSAAVRGCLMLKDPLVREAIARKLDAVEARADRIVEELAYVAFQRAEDVQAVRRMVARGDSLENLPDHLGAAVAAIEETPGKYGTHLAVRAHDKVAALGLLARIRRMLAARVELTGEGGGPVRHAVAVYHIPDNGREVVDAQPIPAAAITDGKGLTNDG